jgi:hypothetical protein
MFDISINKSLERSSRTRFSREPALRELDNSLGQLALRTPTENFILLMLIQSFSRHGSLNVFSLLVKTGLGERAESQMEAG